MLKAGWATAILAVPFAALLTAASGYTAGCAALASSDSIQLLSPSDNASGVSVANPQFTWSACEGSYKYQFELAMDQDFREMVAASTTTSPSYQYPSELDYDATYFWHVRSIEVDGDYVSSSWSAAYVFQTERNPSSEISHLCCIHVATAVAPDGFPTDWGGYVQYGAMMPIFVSVRVKSAPQQSKLTARWALAGENYTPFEDSTYVTGTRWVAFGHPAPRGSWPSGRYDVTLQLDGVETSSVHFTMARGGVWNGGYGPMPLAPNNESSDEPVIGARFSWARYLWVSMWEIDIARDEQFKQIVSIATVNGTSYQYDDVLDQDTTYFWRIRPLNDTREPAPDEWSATYTFRTQPAQPAPSTSHLEQIPPAWFWIVVCISTVLLVLLLVLAFRARRVH